MNPLMDELTFRSYAHNRMMFPDVQPERWAAIFQNVPAMEERLLKTFIAKLMQEIEVADQGRSTSELTESITVGNTGADSSARESAPEYQGTTIENLVATVERVTLNQRIDFEMRLNRKLPSQFDPIHDSNGRW